MAECLRRAQDRSQVALSFAWNDVVWGEGKGWTAVHTYCYLLRTYHRDRYTHY